MRSLMLYHQSMLNLNWLPGLRGRAISIRIIVLFTV